jgi:hypothetical protein
LPLFQKFFEIWAPASKSHFLGQTWRIFGLKKPLFGQGNRDFSASKSHFFGQAFGGVSRGLAASKHGAGGAGGRN